MRRLHEVCQEQKEGSKMRDFTEIEERVGNVPLGVSAGLGPWGGSGLGDLDPLPQGLQRVRSAPPGPTATRPVRAADLSY